MGSTTAKETAEAMMIKETTELTKSPKRNLLPWIVKLIEEKSGCLATAAMKGVSRPFTNEFTTLPKAAPITTPTAIAPEQKLLESFHGQAPSIEFVRLPHAG